MKKNKIGACTWVIPPKTASGKARNCVTNKSQILVTGAQKRGSNFGVCTTAAAGVFGYFTNKQKKMGKVKADIPAMLGHKTAIWYAWEHRERRGRGGGHKEEVPLLKRFVAEKIRC